MSAPDIIALATKTTIEFLDDLPVQSEGDFEVIAEALQALSMHQPTHELSPPLQERMYALKCIIDATVRDECFANLKPVILQCLAQRVDQFRHMTSADKQSYISEQKQRTSPSLLNNSVNRIYETEYKNYQEQQRVGNGVVQASPKPAEILGEELKQAKVQPRRSSHLS